MGQGLDKGPPRPLVPSLSCLAPTLPTWEPHLFLTSLVAQLVKNPPAMQETQVRSLGWEDPPGGGNGNPLQYSHLGNTMDRGTWWATVHGVAKSQTGLSN